MIPDADDDALDEPTIPCRYFLYSETEDGQISVREPACDSEPPPSPPSNRMVLVHTPSAAAGGRQQPELEPPPSSKGLRVSVVRKKDKAKSSE